MLQACRHGIHFKGILGFGEGQVIPEVHGILSSKTREAPEFFRASFFIYLQLAECLEGRSYSVNRII
jgi:hypothetical protein